MLNEETNQALMGAERSAVDAERRFFGVIAVPIDKAEALWHGEVHLVGGNAELAADGAPDLDVNLQSVEGSSSAPPRS